MRTLLVTTLTLTLLAALSGLPGASHAAPSATCQGETATIVGTDGDDEVEGTPGDDVVSLGRGDDTFVGHGGFDVVCTGPGDDLVGVRQGRVVTGGDDDVFDTRLDGSPDRVEVDLRGGHDIAILRSAGTATIHGGAGRDAFHAFGSGRPADEGAFRYHVTGDRGRDSVSFRLYDAAPVRLEMRDTRADLREGDWVTFRRIDMFTGSATQGDVLLGNHAGNVLHGHGGDDVIRGRGGQDFVDGGRGHDSCHGEYPSRCETRD